MKAEIKIRINVPVVVKVTTEWNKRARQSIIVDTELDSSNLITPRTVYEALKPGHYNDLDRDTIKFIMLEFNKLCRDSMSPMPNEPIRGIPQHPKTWSKWMMEMYGVYLSVPVPLIMNAVNSIESDIVIEPVLCSIPTVFIWNAHPEKNVFKLIENNLSSIKSPNLEITEEGCLKLQWKR